MPFTPSILEEKNHTFLKNSKQINSPYMTIGFQTKEIAKSKIPATLPRETFL